MSGNALFRFLVRSVLPAVTAVFFILDAARLLLLVFRRRVVAPFALRAFKCNNVSHFRLRSRLKIFIAFELATGISAGGGSAFG